MNKVALGLTAAMAAMTFGAGIALAGQEQACSKQYALEDHLLLEWAALGGDPHAQMAIAQCSFPEGADAAAMTAAERTYAIRWTTVALCESAPSDGHDRRDTRLRALKEDANISFRRFGGLSKDEKLNWRERDFMEFRKEQTALLRERHDRLLSVVTATELATARKELSDQLARMGPTGLLKLAEFTSCDAFGASPEFDAAAWSAASEAWRGAEHAGVYAAADSEDYDLPKIAMEKTKKLSGADRRVASIEKERLLRTDPKRLAELEGKVRAYEDEAAADRLASFSVPARRAEAGLADVSTPSGPSLTTALQFALESLGYVSFVNGPDNDYGPTTQAAVARMTMNMPGGSRTALSNPEIRATICKAALSNDPVSLYHVALMYQNGWGFPASDAKAAAAIAKSEMTMIAALGGDGLPAWKREAYKAYAGKIRAAAKELKRADVSADDALCH